MEYSSLPPKTMKNLSKLERRISLKDSLRFARIQLEPSRTMSGTPQKGWPSLLYIKAHKIKANCTDCNEQCQMVKYLASMFQMEKCLADGISLQTLSS